MGVHYFYTWVTTRYPMIKLNYEAEQIPQIDHLYLDMNGVLYLCARDSSALFKDILCGKKMEEIFIEILNYVNYIVNLIRPAKSLVISIDGVSPRCKIQNQRTRRFISSMKQKSFNDFLESNLKIPAGAINFKNNSITPGTDFMSDLIEQMHFFIKRKVAEDANWARLKVFFSGGDVPGEGEHKILEHIRQWKRSPDFNVNDSHCLYSGDSDLILLSLVMHLPNMMVLRESFAKIQRKVTSSATKRHRDHPRYEVIFISILREYIGLEFRKFESKAPNHLERLIDDFVFFTSIIGNDFIHQLFCMNAKRGSYDFCLDTLLDFYLAHNQFLTDGTNINLASFCKLIEMLAPLEKQMVSVTLDDFNKSLRELQKSKIFFLLPEDKKQLEKVRRAEVRVPSPVKAEYYEKEIKKDRNEETVSETEVDKSKDSSQVKPLTLQQIEQGVSTNKDQLSNFNFDEMTNKLLQMEKETLSLSKPEPVPTKEAPVFPAPTAKPVSAPEEPAQKEDLIRDDSNQVDLERKDTNIREIIEEDIDSNISSHEQPSDNESPDTKISDVYLAEFWENYMKIKKAKENIEKIYLGIKNQTDYKKFYYTEYLEMKNIDEELPILCYDYLKALTFVLNYYKHGCPSWTWFFKHSHPPLMSDLHNYLLTRIQKNELPKFTFNMEEPVKPFVQLLYVLPIHSLNLLPDSLVQGVLADNSPIKKYYPVKYDFHPTDQIKDYTWQPQIRFIEEADMRKFEETFDWSVLKEIKEKNQFGREFLYRYDPSKKLKVKPTLTGFSEFDAPLSCEPVEKKPRIDSQINNNFDYLEDYQQGRFPTLTSFDNLKAQKILIKERYVLHFLLSQNTIKNFFLSFTQYMSKSNSENRSDINVYIGFVFKKIFRLNRVSKVHKNQPEYQKYITAMETRLQENYFLLPDNLNWGAVAPILPIVSVSEPVFAYMSKNSLSKKPRPVIIKQAEELNIPFIAVSFQRPYPTLKMYDDKVGNSFLDNTTVLDLLKGNLFRTEAYSADQSQIVPLRLNDLTNNINVPNDNSNFLQLEWAFIKQLGLKDNQIVVFWIILGTLKIDCDPNISSISVLGDTFDVGLNFMNFLNKDVSQWVVVSDFVRLRLLERKFLPDKRYCYVDERNGKLHEVYLSKEAILSIQEYFQKNPEIVDYLKENGDTLIYRSNRGKVVKTIFRARNVFKEQFDKGEDINILLFNIYAKVMRQPHSSRLLHSSLSLYYSQETIFKKLANFGHEVRSSSSYTVSPFNCVRYATTDDPIWPSLRRKPDFHNIGDRVVVLNSHNFNAKFGALGTIIGVYKESIEIIFDEPFIGANDLCGRVPKFRGQMLKFFDVFNLSKWSELIVKEQDKFKELWDGSYDLSGLISLLKEESRKFRRN